MKTKIMTVISKMLFPIKKTRLPASLCLMFKTTYWKLPNYNDRFCCPDTEDNIDKMTEAEVSDVWGIPKKCLFPHANI